MNDIQKAGPLVILLLIAYPIIVWYPTSSWVNTPAIYRSIGQISALVGATLFFANFILSARFKMIEKLFFGLNRVFIYHHIVGTWALILLLVHPTFIILSNLSVSVKSAFFLILPSIDNIAVTFGLLALLVILVILIITLYTKIHYETWKSIHQWLGIALVFGFLHTLLIPSTISTNSALALYIFGLATMACFSFTFRMVNKYFRLNSRPFTIESVFVDGGVTKITMTPKLQSFEFSPGQFIFITIDKAGIRRENHPFSLTSVSGESKISIAAKVVGDYTKTLPLATPGAHVYVEGPYGRFSYEYFKNKKQLWIAGGIGVTPFVSMIKSIPVDYQVKFYYLVSDISEAVFENEIKQIVTQKNNIQFNLHESKIKGRLQAENLAQLLPDLKEYEIFICGPAGMMYSLRDQFKKIGIKGSQIHTEEFALN